MLAINQYAFCQISPKADSAIEKAKYLKEDITKYLEKNTLFSRSGLERGVTGDVVISLVVNKSGILDSLVIVSSPDQTLSTSAIAALSTTEQNWGPARFDNKPVDRKYLIIFRFRIYMNSLPIEYKRTAGGFFRRQKYDKALKDLNKAIEENPYDYELFESRSKVKEILGDKDGAKPDLDRSKSLNSEILSVANIVAIGMKRQVREVGVATTRIR